MSYKQSGKKVLRVERETNRLTIYYSLKIERDSFGRQNTFYLGPVYGD